MRIYTFDLWLWIGLPFATWHCASFASFVALVLLSLALWWLGSMRALMTSSGTGRAPAVVLHSIALSHFVEKVRWSLDLLGVDYAEELNVGVLRVFLTARTVPMLDIQGLGTVGDSSNILRVLYGLHADKPAAAFLAPQPGTRELEQTLDTYGRDVQVFAYAILLRDAALVSRAWGVGDVRTPLWQRVAARLLQPLIVLFMHRIFGTNVPAKVLRSRERLETVLHVLEDGLAGQGDDVAAWTLVPGTAPGVGCYVNIEFAALSVWAHAESYTDGVATGMLPRSLADPDPLFIRHSAALSALHALRSSYVLAAARAHCPTPVLVSEPRARSSCRGCNLCDESSIDRSCRLAAVHARFCTIKASHARAWWVTLRTS